MTYFFEMYPPKDTDHAAIYKNPDNPNATVEFEHVSEAYRIILTHVDSEGDDDLWADYYYGSDDDEIPLEIYLIVLSSVRNSRNLFPEQVAL